MPVATTVHDWGDAMMASLTGAMALFSNNCYLPVAIFPTLIAFPKNCKRKN